MGLVQWLKTIEQLKITVSLIRDFLYCNNSKTMGVNKESVTLNFVILSGC